ncbi:hypothetical protein DID75_03795 [Candidatus Marinamargulisbacteria bacterium SCGC AG-410-N11]|nr:hypothetical protein DID75_03795 [Candidatus Marinamargulisbacteria bacterium SCGC AG-410-N11]
MTKPLISVVIGCFNQEHVIKRVLDSFNNQTLPLDQFELIVVDSMSTDSTLSILESFKANYLFRYIQQENLGKAMARNRGVNEALADLILITDADMIADRYLLQAHIDAHEESGKNSCFEGVTYNMTELHWPPEQQKLYSYIRPNYSHKKSLGWFYFLTGNISFPKSVFLAENGFNSEFKSYGWEDLELGYRLSKKRVPLYYNKLAINYHYHVVSKDEEIERNIKKGESARIFLKLHPELTMFLGLNPLSKFIFPLIKKESWFYKLFSCFFKSNIFILKSFGFWFLKEWHYMQGILKK